MKIKKVLLLLAEEREVLNDKWWHRIFVVLFVVCVSLFLVVSIFVSRYSIRENYFNTSVKNNLRNFSANSDTYVRT